LQAGLPPLHAWITELQTTVHNPPLGMDKYSIIAGNGSQDLFTRAFDNMVEQGDTVLVESPTYAGALAALAPLGCNIVGQKLDLLFSFFDQFFTNTNTLCNRSPH